MSRKNKKINVFLIIGLLLIVVALLIIVYNIYDEKRAGESAVNALSMIEKESIEPISANIMTNELGEYNLDGISSEDEVPDFVLNPEMDMPEVNIEGQDYIGTIDIPAIDRKLPVISTWDYAKLKIAPCVYSGTAYQNNLIILAHNYNSHFGSLSKLIIGDKVSFTDMEGNLFNYKVVEKEVLDGGDVENMVAGDWDLTLFTCTIGGKSRVAVRCEKE